MESNSLLVGMIIGAAIVVAIMFARERRPINLSKPARVPLGRYLAGITQAPTALDRVECRIDEAAYHFSSHDHDDFGRVHRAAVVNIFAVEKRELLDKLSTTKGVTFASLGIDQKNAESLNGYCLVIDWRDLSDIRHNIIFEYIGPFAKTKAHNDVATLNRFRKPHVAPLLFDQKRCEFCAEIIKKDAVKCKHCDEYVTVNRVAAQLKPH